MSLNEVVTRIAAALDAAGRSNGDVTLIAVSKVQPDDRVRAVLQAGQRVFGENYVQEAAGKWPAFRAEFGPVSLHMIGPLQTNKAKQAVELFDVIQSLDRPLKHLQLRRQTWANSGHPIPSPIPWDRVQDNPGPRITPSTSLPANLSSAGRHGTRLACRSPTISAIRPCARSILRA